MGPPDELKRNREIQVKSPKHSFVIFQTYSDLIDRNTYIFEREVIEGGSSG